MLAASDLNAAARRRTEGPSLAPKVHSEAYVRLALIESMPHSCVRAGQNAPGLAAVRRLVDATLAAIVKCPVAQT
jgi:hypothetical protein